MTDATDLLTRAVGEAARLLEVDGAMIYLVDEATGKLRFAHDAGIRNPKARRLIRDMSLSVGVGMFGTAVARRELLVTDDYPNDDRFVHFGPADEVVELAEMRSMVVAPLLVNDQPIGAMGAYLSRTSAFSEAQVALLRALADHAAAAIGNQRLLERLASSEARYRDLVEGSPDVVWATNPAGDFTFLSETVEQLTGWRADELIGRHWSSIVAEEDRTDFERRWREAQADGSDDRRARFTVERRDGTRAVVELRGRETLVEGRSAGAHGSMRDITELDELERRLRARTAELARQVETQATLQRIAARITAIRDPDEVLQAVVDAALRLLGSDGAHLTLRDSQAPILRPHVMAGGMDADARAWLATQEFPIEGGLNGLAVQLDTTVWTADYLVDPRIPHEADDQQVAEQMGLRGMAVAPLRAPGGAVFGTLAISFREPHEISEGEVDVLQGLADIGAIAIANARLNDQLTASEMHSRQQAAELERVVQAQRALAEIAVQITSIRDPAVLLQRTVDEAARLLDADLALINPLTGDASLLEWAVAHAPRDQPLDDVDVTPGQGVSGLAFAERRVIRTGDYLNDAAIEHTPELDEYIGRRGMHSVMAAPLESVDAPIGTLTVQATRTHAFSEDDEQILGALAAQAAVAITNARLYEQQRESERRYRHLVDHSPDLVWSVDAEGRFTYVGESLERITGFRPDDLIGKHWAELTEPSTAHIAAAGWQSIVDDPDRDEQFRILLPVVGGGVIPAEINMTGTAVEGRFTGAHGSIRDIRERERLEEDLRRRSAELAANEERANLARELHDSVTQALFSIGLTLRALEILLDRDPQAARGKLVELRDLQKDALAEMRNLIFELRPRGLEADGLAQALRTHAAAVQGRTGLAVSVAVDLEDRLPLDTEEALYRIAQEALHNVVKHANARAARIALKRSGRQAQLTVEDNGVGFDPAATPRGHLGLVGMRQRAEGLGGGLEVKRPPAGGTRVRATIPLPPDASVE